MIKISTTPAWLQRFLKGAFWFSIGAVVSKLIIVLVNYALARLFGSTGFGKINFIQNTVNTSASIASFGLNLAITKHVAEYQKQPADLSGIISLSLLLVIIGGGIIGGALILFAPQISHALLHKDETTYLRLSGICVFFTVFSLMIANILSGLERFKDNSTIQILSNLVMAALVLIGGVLGGVDYSIYALVAGYAITSIFCIVPVWKIIKNLNVTISFSAAKSKHRILYKYTLPSFLSGTMVTIATWYANTLVIKNAGFNEYGVFSAANQLFFVVANLNRIVGSVLLPIYIANTNAGKKSKMLEVFNLGFAWSISIVIGGVAIIFSDAIAALLGKDYQVEHWNEIVALVMFSAITTAHRQGVIRLILEREQLWLSLLGNIIWVLTLIIFLNSFISLGALGFAISLAAAYGVNAIFVNSLFLYLKIIPPFFLVGLDTIGIWAGVLMMITSSWAGKFLGHSMLLQYIGFALCIGSLLVFWSRKRA